MGSNGLIDIRKQLINDRELFDVAFKDIVNQVVGEDEKNVELSQVSDWLRKVINYNTFDGKKSRGLMVLGTVNFLRHGKASDDDLKKAVCLGWCVEILQAVFLVADDIMDRSEMRRGKPCWYKQCGLVAINDTYLMQQCIYKLIDNHFSEELMRYKLYKLFHDIIFYTAKGQELDMLVSEPPNGEFSLNLFTLEKYKSIVKYKTAYYSFYLPVALGMIVAGISEPKSFLEAESILMKLGEFFQIQDDFLDCYGDPAVMGKIGRDIEDRKCSWLVVQTLDRVTTEEKALLEENYGKEDQEAVAKVKELYKKLDLQSIFKTYEEDSYKEICEMIKSKANYMPKELFLFLVEKIYKRQK